VAGLLELSRPTVTPVAVDLRGLCEDVASALRVAVEPRALRLSVEGAGLVLGDGPRLRQVIFNLVRNALEAARPAGEVKVLARTSGDSVEVAVSDSGPGIAAEARERLFEPFFTTKPTGTGLGLAVSRAIALAHGGDIDVRDGDSGGAVFTLRLPRASTSGG
jgi:signal transduction histidine kinase